MSTPVPSTEDRPGVGDTPRPGPGTWQDGHPVLGDIATKPDGSAAQVALAWLRGVTAIPEATGAGRAAGDRARVDREKIEHSDAIDREARQIDPSWAPR